MNSRFLVRITAPTILSSLLLLAVGVVAAWYVHQLQKNSVEMVASNIASIRAAEELEIGLREVRTQLDHFLITGDRKHLDAVPGLRAETDHWLAEAERVAFTDKEKELIARTKQGYAHFFDEFDRFSRDTPPAALHREVSQLIDEVFTNEILAPAHEYLDYNEEQVQQASDENQALVDRLVPGLLLFGVCGAAAGLLAGIGLARGVRRSLVQLSLPVRDAAGKLGGVVGPVTLMAGWDLPELEGVLHKIAERIGVVIERLQDREREVLRAEQMATVGRIAAGMAHEVRNPLMAMKLLVQSAEGSRSAGLHGRDLAVLEEEIDRLERLVQAFLDFARPPRPEKRPVEVRPVLEDAVALVAGRARQQGVRLHCQAPGVPVRVEADAGQLRQVLLNLLLNALDAVPSGGSVWAELDVAGVRDPAGRRATIRVADDGPGLRPGMGEQVFEPFVSTKDKGLGLGLPICRRIVEAHQGAISAADRPGGGAVFTVGLPLS
jgi:signal transduction histidine kinase